jgi:hypothetical protein
MEKRFSFPTGSEYSVCDKKRKQILYEKKKTFDMRTLFFLLKKTLILYKGCYILEISYHYVMNELEKGRI